MESTDLDMAEIFDDRDDNEDIGATGVLPDLPDTQDASQDNDEAENAEVLARLKDLSKGAAKKVVRRPQPKLDHTRLTGDRGIPILPKLFEKTKFKGRGHEASDLALIMRQMEHWGHRLFPKMPFDEVIERVEKLGAKKPVQTCLKRIRMDMPVLDEDFVGSDHEDGVMRNGDMDMNTAQEQGGNAEDMWDELLRDEEEVTASQRMADTGTTPGQQQMVTEAGRSQGRDDGPEFTATRIDTPSTPPHNPTENGGFTPDQLARMEKNKQMALEKRLKKMGRFTPAKPPSTPLASQAGTSDENPANTSVASETSTALAPTDSNSDQVNDSEKNMDNDLQSNVMEERFENGPDSSKHNVNKTSENDIEASSTPHLNLEIQNDSIENCSKTQDCERTVNNDEEMSEEIEKGTSENIKLGDKNYQCAQNWHSGPSSETNEGLPGVSEHTETTERENLDTSVSKTDVVLQKAKVEKSQLEDDIPDELFDSDEEMSEVITREHNSENRVMKRKDNVSNAKASTGVVMSEDTEKETNIGNRVLQMNENIANVGEMSEIIEDQHVKQVNKVKSAMTVTMEEKENVDIAGKTGKEIVDNVGKDVVDMTGDHGNKDNAGDELNEEELMDTLES